MDFGAAIAKTSKPSLKKENDDLISFDLKTLQLEVT